MIKLKISLIFAITCASIVAADDAIIDSPILPDPSEIPTLSNGHIGFVIFGDAILLNGLYNGERGESHRARIPNYSNVVPNVPCTGGNCNYQLNMRKGYFETTRTTADGNHRVVHHIYAHRFYNRAIINRIHLDRVSGTAALNVALSVAPGAVPSIDLTQQGQDIAATIAGTAVTIRCYQTNVIENIIYQPLPSLVCIAHTNPPATLNLAVGQESVSYLHVTTVGRTEAEVRKEMEDALNNQANLLVTHTNVWERDWEKFEISVGGNENLNQIIHGSVFYLVSNLPSETTNQPKDRFWGLSPGGIGKGGILYMEYQGHSFWDTEMWMHPPVLLLNPKWSEDILSYRHDKRQAAADNARNTGYLGYRFPWESGYTGAEVTPDCCPEVVEYQHHIVSDIAYAYRSHLAATHDVEWFKTVGCEIAWNTAKFWESRVKYNATTRFYDIRNVMGPDEDHHDIDNSVYTNVNAAINLLFGDFAGCACKDVLDISEADYENFAKMSRSLKLMYDPVRDFHPQYEGYNNEFIKQADAVLLGYPLQLPMDASTKRNNLLIYDPLTRVNGPAMTWAMHTVGFLDLQDQIEAQKVFERSFTLYTREPFKVWSEVIPGQPGAGNFITGAGGFLQSVINGYGGIRLHFDSMTITNFFVPPQTTSLDFTGITYLNNRFSLSITGNQANVTIVEIDTTRRIRATLRPSGEVFNDIAVGWTRTFNREQELVFEPVSNPFDTCEMKETVLGIEAAGPVVEDEWTVGSNKLPNATDIPSLSNGHVGFVVLGDAISMNGLYNGDTGTSHRARIPNYANIQTTEDCVINDCDYRINFHHAFFESRITSGKSHRVVQQTYAHRYYNRAIISRIVLERLEGNSDLSVTLILNPGAEPSIDLTQIGDTKSDRVANRDIVVRCFETNIVEDIKYQPEKSKVCVAHTVFPSSLSVPSTMRMFEYIHVTAIGHTEEEVKKEIGDIFTREINHDAIFSRHTSAWIKHWDRFGISVKGNLKLSQMIHGSIFYLISNLPSEESNQPNGAFYGLSPSGIAKGGIVGMHYQGHSFWDTEMWMHPPVLLLNPKWSKDILSYRYDKRQAAADNANNTGYLGYRYPWESGFTGREVTPAECCQHVIDYQQHIISDIAFAVKSHFAATHDEEWFKTVGCDIAYYTAKFWQSRVKFNNETNFYDINGIMGPDEDNWPINNNVYTNVNAAINLYFGEFAACACKDVLNVSEEDYEEFAKIAKSITLLYDEENDYHPQYENFVNTTIIKQADVVLLGFPLQFPMEASTKRKDLLLYDSITREDGPAMTWAMHTVGFLDLQEPKEAAKIFERSYSVYTREPFKVWTEVIPGVDGAGNFITGAGGFLQSIINGYGGVRLHFDSMTISNFYVPPFSSNLEFTGIYYLNNRFSLTITDEEAIVVFKELDTDHPIKITLKPDNLETFDPAVGSEFKLNRDQTLVIEGYKKPFESCELKETILGLKAGGAAVKISFVLMVLLGIFAMKF